MTTVAILRQHFPMSTYTYVNNPRRHIFQ